MNSLEFVKNRIINGYTKMNLEDFESLIERDLDNFLLTDEILSKDSKDNIISTVSYNPDCDYDYFTMSSCRCDGTLMFYDELVNDVIERVLYKRTYFNKLKIDNSDDYIFHYTIGNLIFGNEYSESKFGIKEKPWICTRFTVMLPIKFRVEKIIKEEKKNE